MRNDILIRGTSLLLMTVMLAFAPANTYAASIEQSESTLYSSSKYGSGSNAYTIYVQNSGEQDDFNSVNEIKAAEDEIYSDYLRDIRNREQELEKGEITIDGMTMNLKMQVIGQPDSSGYPLYIAFHGGSSGVPSIEDEQYELMANYLYSHSIESGVYITPRALTDIFDQHYRPESFVFYDRIIEDAIAFYNVDPNRVYILGFSSGGDGVYAIAPRFADRLAAADASAGFPHVHLLDNLYNLPFCVQVGENDNAYERNTHAAEFHAQLNNLSKKYSGGFIHKTFIHVDGTHNEGWGDTDSSLQVVVKQSDISKWLRNPDSASTEKVNTSAVAWVNQYIREPLPETLIWNTGEYAGMRESQMFYWLDRDGYLKNVRIEASYDSAENRVEIKSQDTMKGTLKIYLNPNMVDVFDEVTLDIQGQQVTVQPVVSKQIMESTLAARGDRNYIFTSEIDVKFDPENKRIDIIPVKVNETDYAVVGRDNLIYFDENGLFYVDQSLLGCSYSEICQKLDMRLTEPVICDWLTDGSAVAYTTGKYSLQGTTQGRYLTGGVPPVRFSM